MPDHDPARSVDDERLEIDAREIAPMLGLTPERLMAELRAGQVYHSAEESSDGANGRLRLTFRYRARVARVVVESDGSMHPEHARTH